MRSANFLVLAVLIAAGCKSNTSDKPAGERGTSNTPDKSEGERVDVPSDPKATYYVLERTGDNDHPVETTKRVGPSGDGYARREFDCQNRTWRYLAEGDTMEELAASKKSDQMGPLVDGSIADVMWHHACHR
jgi:hypothetical protein